MWTFYVLIRHKIKYNRQIEEICKNIESDRYIIYHQYDNDILKKPILKTPVRINTGNISDDTDTIDPSLIETLPVVVRVSIRVVSHAEIFHFRCRSGLMVMKISGLIKNHGKYVIYICETYVKLDSL